MNCDIQFARDKVYFIEKILIVFFITIELD
jgi:hypothetical protein